MQRITERVSVAYLDQQTPRPFPYAALLDLLSDHIVQPALRHFLDPLFLTGVVVLVVLLSTNAHPLLCLLALLVVLLRLVAGLQPAMRRFSDEVALLRHGLALRAHILRLQPYRTVLGGIDGATLDCAIVVAPRRTYIGSIWLSDGTEALHLARQGRIQVICLPRTPGTWRVIENLQSEIRYDRMGPIQAIPPE